MDTPKLFDTGTCAYPVAQQFRMHTNTWIQHYVMELGTMMEVVCSLCYLHSRCVGFEYLECD